MFNQEKNKSHYKSFMHFNLGQYSLHSLAWHSSETATHILSISTKCWGVGEEQTLLWFSALTCPGFPEWLAQEFSQD